MEICAYYLCQWDGEIHPNQPIARDKFSGTEYIYHLKCFVLWLKERQETREMKGGVK